MVEKGELFILRPFGEVLAIFNGGGNQHLRERFFMKVAVLANIGAGQV